jgi:ABC-type branched-subunit amino acid transport system substrate-binding protein
VSGRTAVPVITLCPDLSLERAGVPWMIRIVPRTDDEARALFEGITAMGPGKPTRWVALVPDERAGREVSHDLKQAAAACRQELLKCLQVNSAGTNLEDVTTRALGVRPEGILLWLAPDCAGKAAWKLRNAGYKGLMAGPGWLQSSDFFAGAGAAADIVIVPGVACTPQELARWVSFEDSYRRRWGHDPDLAAGMSYDAVRLFVQLVSQDKFRAPPHRVPIGFSWPGVTGDLSFDSQGNRIAKLELLKARNGRFIRTGPGH